MSTPRERCGAFDTLTHEVCILANDHRGRHVMESDEILAERIRAALTDEVMRGINDKAVSVLDNYQGADEYILAEKASFAAWREGIVKAIMEEYHG